MSPRLPGETLGDFLRRVGCPSVRIRYRDRATSGGKLDYHPELARFPGDREAFVDGERALRKLVDARRRQGWELYKDWGELDALSRPTDDEPEAGVFMECLEEAKAEVQAESRVVVDDCPRGGA